MADGEQICDVCGNDLCDYAMCPECEVVMCVDCLGDHDCGHLAEMKEWK